MSSSGNFPLTFKLQVQGDAEVVNKFKQIATAMNQVAPAATKTSQSAKQAETSLKSVGTSAGSASTALTGLSAKAREIGSSMSTTSSSTNTASTSFTGLSTSASAAAQGVDATKTSVAATTPQMASMGNEGVKTKGKLQQLTDVFQGNKGLIFSTTMLSSGIVEAIGMSQGWQDASEKLTQAKEKEADLLARGMEGTKEYGEAVKDVADAQRGYNFITRFTIQSFGDLVPMTLMLSSSLLGLVSDVGGLTAAKTKLAAAGTKLVGVIKAVGAAMLAVVSSNKLLTM
ncbi:MAG TPA: hypothetical protein VL854_04260, partial [Nitrososphaeraceae archaeon]|nr:hypothetical protein [Nitrososphaeraceae archaeon]